MKSWQAIQIEEHNARIRGDRKGIRKARCKMNSLEDKWGHRSQRRLRQLRPKQRH